MKDIEKAKKEYVQLLEELESDMSILSDRVNKAKKIIQTIRTIEDMEKFNSENDIEEGLMHIALFH